MCADGRPQRVYKTKAETYSQRVITKSLFIICSIETRENGEVATVDIHGVFLQTKASKDTFIKLQGSMVHTLLSIDHSWTQCVVYEGNKRVPTIYSEVDRAIYGSADDSKLLFENLVTFLVDELDFTKMIMTCV